MSEKKDYIFIFTITPVQSFISQARKTRDLFAGSQILSELTKEAIKLAKNKSAEIIMPTGNLEKAHSISNKFVAIFKDIEEEDLESIGRDIEFRTLFYWKKEIANETLKNAKNKFDGKSKNYSDFSFKFNDHITKYFNIYWLFYPIENNSYENAYKEAEKYLGAIKNIRCFEQFNTEENNRKCSICGERDAIVYKQGSNPSYKYQNSLDLKTHLLETDEGLCGICFVKRFYSKGEIFPSTAKIAFSNVLNEASKELSKKLENYKGFFLKQYHFFNEQLYYEENLTQNYFRNYGFNPDYKRKYSYNQILRTYKI